MDGRATFRGLLRLYLSSPTSSSHRIQRRPAARARRRGLDLHLGFYRLQQRAKRDQGVEFQYVITRLRATWFSSLIR